jgi:hypothetical protein
MALAQIIDLEERRRARQAPAIVAPIAGPTPAWCYVWMPIYFWYVT